MKTPVITVSHRSASSLGHPLLTLLSLAGAVLCATAIACHSAPSPTTPLPQPAAGERICLSLRVLSELAASAKAAGKPLPPEAFNLGGIGWVEGYVVEWS